MISQELIDNVVWWTPTNLQLQPNPFGILPSGRSGENPPLELRDMEWLWFFFQALKRWVPLFFPTKKEQAKNPQFLETYTDGLEVRIWKKSVPATQSP